MSTTLTHLQTITEGVGGITGLDSPNTVLVSPDGAHVYVRNGSTAIGVFERDDVTGSLTSVATYELGVDWPALPGSSWKYWISPDGEWLYLGANSSSSAIIAVLDRDPATGTLAFVEQFPLPSGGIGTMAFSPGGEHLYPASYGHVNVLSRHPTTGELSFVEVFTANKFFTTEIEATPDGRFLYVLNEGQKNIRAFSRDLVSGKIKVIQKVTLTNNTVCPGALLWGCDQVARNVRSIEMSPDGAFLYAAGSHDLRNPLLDTWAIAADGKLEHRERHYLEDCFGTSEDPPFGTPQLLADGLRLISTEAVFMVDPTTGAQSFSEFVDDDLAAGSTGPFNGFDLSPDMKHYYITVPTTQSIEVYSIGASPPTPVRHCRYWGRKVVVSNAASGLVTRIRWSAAGRVLVPVENGPADPRCGADPVGTVKASVRFASTATGADTGEIPLPCQNWTTFGSPKSLTRGYKYLDKEKDDGPCKKVQLRGDKSITATCDNTGPSPLSYDLTEGISQEDLDAVLTLGDIRYCNEFHPHNGKDGADGRTYRGKKDYKPNECPTF